MQDGPRDLQESGLDVWRRRRRVSWAKQSWEAVMKAVPKQIWCVDVTEALTALPKSLQRG